MVSFKALRLPSNGWWSKKKFYAPRNWVSKEMDVSTRNIFLQEDNNFKHTAKITEEGFAWPTTDLFDSNWKFVRILKLWIYSRTFRNFGNWLGIDLLKGISQNWTTVLQKLYHFLLYTNVLMIICGVWIWHFWYLGYSGARAWQTEGASKNTARLSE